MGSLYIYLCLHIAVCHWRFFLFRFCGKQSKVFRKNCISNSDRILRPTTDDLKSAEYAELLFLYSVHYMLLVSLPFIFVHFQSAADSLPLFAQSVFHRIKYTVENEVS